MILRGLHIAEGSRTLHVPRPAAAPSVGARLAAKDFEPSTLAEPHVAEAIPASPTAAITLPHKEELTFEAVAAWLAVQDNDTRQDCTSMLADELTAVYEKARVEGHAAGKAAGAKAAAEECEAQLAVLRAIADGAQEAFDAESTALANACADIVCEAFAKICGPLLCTREAALGAVEQVLKRVKETREVIIRVHAADVERLAGCETALGSAMAGRKFTVVPDARVELGGCIVESKLGSLDGRFEAQIRELFELLRASKLVAAERA